MKAPQAHPNPAGKHGKPISLAPYSFDEALRKILKAAPPANPTKKTPRKTARKK